MSSEERIDQIRDAALALFAERGYLATTMADIGSAVGIRGPSIYKHVPSKQHLLAEIMTATMRDLQTGFDQATASTDDAVDRFRRAVDAHVRFHARRRLEAFVGTREIRNLEPEPHDQVVAQRTRYENGFRELIEEGAAAGVFHTRSPKLASYAVLDMGMGISVWYREDGDLAEDALAYAYDDHALRLVGYRQLAGH
ncbi:TetR/AcrR family transcriptional regulator [Amycolatopsis nivea]